MIISKYINGKKYEMDCKTKTSVANQNKQYINVDVYRDSELMLSRDTIVSKSKNYFKVIIELIQNALNCTIIGTFKQDLQLFINLVK